MTNVLPFPKKHSFNAETPHAEEIHSSDITTTYLAPLENVDEQLINELNQEVLRIARLAKKLKAQLKDSVFNNEVNANCNKSLTIKE